MNIILFFKKNIDSLLLFLALLMTFFGMLTYYSPDGNNILFWKQSISLALALIFYFFVTLVDTKYLKNSRLIIVFYFIVISLFIGLEVLGAIFSGAQSWFHLGFFAFQPTDFAKLVLVILLAKYFFRRHVQINKIKHLFVSAFYMLIIFLFLLKQPDLGSAVIVFFIWFVMILLFGVSRKYVLNFVLFGVLISTLMFFFVLADYQKQRIYTFINPELDRLGAGYNIWQAHVSLGSGGVLGKGISNGTQSHLHFLPEYETDFIFSAFGEEWGFVGVVLLLIVFMIFLIRIMYISYYARSNFETMLALGILVYYLTHFTLHVGINLGLLPVTGTTIPFMSYGGSHLLVEFISLGILNSIRRSGLKYNRVEIKKSTLYF